MKKRILFWMPSMHIGGAESALIGLLCALDYTKVDVDLFLNRHEGELLNDIPSEVNILDEVKQYTCLAEPLLRTIKRGHPLIAAARVVGKIAAKRFSHGKADGGVTGEYSHKFTQWLMPRIQRKVSYDLAVSFVTPHYFVAKKVSARNKVAWIHTDYSKLIVDVKSQLKMWGAYDRIVSISEAVGENYLKVFPQLGDKLVLIENIMPVNSVREKAEQPIDLPNDNTDGAIRLLSIGRFCNAKNFDNVPEICSLLLKQGLNVYWYLIGYGEDEQEIKKNIMKNGMQDRVLILGKKKNPYPYIKACDVYVQPSRYEGKAVTVREAQALGKPVVITDFPTAKSQLHEGVDGLIVPMNNKGCAEGIAELLRSPEQMRKLSEACLSNDYSNAAEAEKLYAMVDT